MIIELKDGQLTKPVDLKDGVYTLEKVKKTRSNGQNKYMHKILFPMIAEGMSKVIKKPVSMEFAKSVMKYKFLQVFTEAGTIVMPTSKLNTKECMDFVEKCQQYGAEMLGVDIPSPSEESYRKIEE